MSGITPLLDTLLHQVLGKRVDTAPAKPLTEPVKPTLPAEAVPAVHSDSRLQSGPRPLAAKAITSTEQSAVQRPQSETPRPQMDHLTTGSAQTHFSAAARAIADLLARYPAPPSAIRPPSPLLTTSEDGHPEILAKLLRASIERSGLFYESHLKRWYRGLEGLEQLAKEPQMRLTHTIANRPSVTTPPSAERDTASRATSAPPDEGRMGSASEQPESVRIPLDKSASDTLQGLLRHQLEMLASPVLRWEGEVWPGVTMALILAPLSEYLHRDAGGEAEEKPAEDQEKGWQSQLILRLPDFGEIRIDLALKGERLELSLAIASKEAASVLSDAIEPLRERFLALGFKDVLLTVETQNREEQ